MGPDSEGGNGTVDNSNLRVFLYCFTKITFTSFFQRTLYFWENKRRSFTSTNFARESIVRCLKLEGQRWLVGKYIVCLNGQNCHIILPGLSKKYWEWCCKLQRVIQSYWAYSLHRRAIHRIKKRNRKRIYSGGHYWSNKHMTNTVSQIEAEIQLVL